MNDFNKEYFKQLFEETFGEYVSELTNKLKAKDDEYCTLVKKRYDMTEKNEKLSNIFNEMPAPNGTMLSQEDIKLLNDYFDVINEIHYKEEQEIYLAGASICYLTLKKLDLLK